MLGSIRIGTILGIPVGMNWSVLLVAWLIAFSLAGQVLPAQVPGLEGIVYWVAGAVVAALFFGSLLAHELSHALVARREGLQVSDITLWLLGGVARMEGEARSPGAEARIAGVGPLTSFALALVFGAVTVALALAPASEATALATAAAGWLSFVNLVLAVFNLLPGAPLDGGRIAHALFWRLRRDKLGATRWATALGQLLGYGLIAVGLLRAFAGDLSGIWFVLLGFFLNASAGAERRATELTHSLLGVTVGDVMTRYPLRVPAGLTVDTFMAAAPREDLPSSALITGPGGTTLGVLALRRLQTVRGDDRLTTRLGDLATPLDQAAAAYTDEPVLDVLARLHGDHASAVVRERTSGPDEVVGVLTPDGVSRAVEHGRWQEGGASSTDGSTSEGRVLP